MITKGFGMRLPFVFWLAFLLSVVTAPAGAKVAGPGWFNAIADPVSPQQARQYYSSQPLTLTMASATLTSTPQTAPEIVALARTLQHDPKLIYEYVHDHIDYVPYYGYLKGPVLTLLDRSGNDFDQAALMVALLRASGITAQFVYGQMTIPNFLAANQRDMQHWLGVDASNNVINQLLSSGGIPNMVGSASTAVDRVWVQATVNGAGYVFDPAFKVYHDIAGIDLKATMAYAQADLLAAAGGTSGTDYIQNLSAGGLQNQLTAYSDNLVAYLRGNAPNADMSEVIGGREIVPEVLAQLPVSIAFPNTVTATWADIPSAYIHTVRIQHGGIDQTLNIPDIGAHKVSLTYDSGLQLASLGVTSVDPVINAAASGPVAAASGTVSVPSTLVSEPPPAQDLMAQSPFSAGGNITMQSVQPSVDMGRVTPNFSGWPTWGFRYTNGNTVAISISTSLPNNASGAYRFLSGAGTTVLNPGQSVDISIEFNGTGQGRGAKTATFHLDQIYAGTTIASDDWPLTGFVADPPNINLSGYTGVTAFLNEPADQTVGLVNNGGFPLSVDTPMTLTGANPTHFQLLSGQGAGSIAAGATRSINWRYLADVHTGHHANINVTFTYDGIPYGASDLIALNGTTKFRPDLTGSLGVGFNQRYLNDSADATATLINSGGQPLTVNSVTLTGADAARFQLLSGNGSGSLTAGASRDIGVRYPADTIGLHSAAIHIGFTYDGLTSSVDLPLSGETISAPAAQLWLEDTLLAQESPPVSGAGLGTMTLTIDHPYAADTGTYSDQTSVYNLTRGSTYVIISEFGGSRDGKLLQQRQRHLDALRASGLADNSREVLTETLNVMGQTWMRQTTLSDDLLAEIADVITIRHHRFGIMAQETGYYVDVKSQQGSNISRHGLTANANAVFRAGNFLASALEHGMLEQVQGVDRPAVSTVRLLNLANQNGDKIFSANSANWSAIRPQLAGYAPADLTTFDSRIAAGAQLVLPANGQIVFNQWRGNGYIDFQENANGSASVGMIISGNLFGGYLTVPGSADPQLAQNNYVTPLLQNADVQTLKSQEPVDMTTGAYLYDHQDLSLGESAPKGLGFTRRYNSDEVNTAAGNMGHGWDHSYDVVLNRHSDIDGGLGLSEPVDAAAMLVASVVTLDLMNAAAPDLKDWTVSTLIGQWSMDQLFENALSVRLQDKALTFIQLPDGTYNSPAGITTQLVDVGGGLFELHERFGTVIKFNAAMQVASITDVDDNALSFSYVGNRLDTVTDSVGRTLTFGYTGNLLTTVTDSTGRGVTFGYDGNNDLTSYTDPDGKIWRYGYDSGHRILTLIDPLNITLATNTYDSLGNVATQTYPRQGGATVTFNYYFSDFRNIEEASDATQTIYNIDTKGRTVAVEDALGNAQSTAFDGQNHVVQTTDPRGNSSHFVYDGDHNLIDERNALNLSTTHSYDAQFQLRSTTDPLSHTTLFDYDTKHHLTLTTDAENNTVGAGYYPDGRVQTSTDGRATVTNFTYDVFGNPDTTQVGTHPVVNADFDAFGRRTALTDQAGATTQFTYDNRGLVTGITDPLGQVTGFVYDDASRLIRRTDRNNATVDFAYTPTGKTDTITYPDASTVHFTYDSAHENVTTMTDALGTSSYSYDSLSRIKSQTDAQGFTVQYAYDEAGNLTTLTYPGNKTVTYTYDVLNRLETVTNWLSETATYSYDDAGRLTRVTDFNGTYAQYGYDNADRLISIANRRADNSLISAHDFTLDGNGNRISETRDTPSVPTGWRVEVKPFSYNIKRNRLLNTDTATFTYDNEGQQIQKTATGFNWDYEHRLTGIGADAFYYDGTGNRLKAVRNGVTTKYIYDAQGNLLAETDQAGAVTAYYIHGLGLLAMITPDNHSYSYHFDATGHTVALTGATGGILNKYSYSPYGQLLAKQETIAQPFTYVGQQGVMTEPNGLYYMRARYYDAETGRFISEDPIGLDGGINLYAYVGGNPVSLVDPSGLIPPGWAEQNLYGGLINYNRQAQTADFFGGLARYSAYAAVASGAMGQPEGVTIFGVIGAGSAALEQIARPDVSGAVTDSAIDLTTSRLPPQIGDPLNLFIKEASRIQASSRTPFIRTNNYNPEALTGCNF